MVIELDTDTIPLREIFQNFRYDTVIKKNKSKINGISAQ